jgi:hypothetical protein
MRRRVRAARRYRTTSQHELGLLVSALATVVTARVALSTLPFRVIARVVARSPRTADDGGPTPEAIADAVRSAAVLVPRSTCLVQALAGQALMRHYGHRSQLSIGVARAGPGQFNAHAWLETTNGGLLGAENLDGLTTLLTSPRS